MSAKAVVASRERSAGTTRPRDDAGERPTGDLWDRFFEQRDVESRAALTEAYLSLVRYVVARMKPLLPDFLERENLVQYGVFGLVDAIDRFQPSRGVRFETFAVPRIKGAILDAVRSNDWAPRSVRAREKELAQAAASLEARLKRSPTPDELMAEMGINRPAFEHLRVQVAQGRIAELDQHSVDLVPDEATDPEAAFERSEELRLLRQCIAQLPEREQRVLALYYFDELTLKQIGEVLGVTEGWVCKIHAKAIRAILDIMGTGGG